MPQLVLIRHGQSEWNRQNRFTGWVDVDLTEDGVAEARRAGELLSDTDFKPDLAFVSVLKRAIRTLNFTLEGLDRLWVPVTKSWRLNERHYGGLTGLNKAETTEKHGADQVKIWRRSFDIPPPLLDADHEYHPSQDSRYADIPAQDLPGAESLKSTLDRVQPYWEAEIRPALADGRNVLIAAHGNSLRALVKLLFEVNDTDIIGVEIPTGNPLLVELTDDTLVPVSARYLDADRAQPLPAVKQAAA